MKKDKHTILKAGLSVMLVVFLLQSCKDEVAVTGISLDKNTYTMKAGETVNLDATVLPLDASNGKILWESASTDVATVADGVVTALSEGESTITATTVDGSFSASCVITVNPASGSILTVSGEITANATWEADYTYLLSGFVYVTDGVTLTIKPGTIIKGDKATKATLIIERGAKLMAEGTADSVIVFTSNQPKGSRSYGDWGGLILCGKAPINTTSGEAKIEGGPRSYFGGTDATDNSGILKYVRVEFCGVEYATDNEINGVTLGGIGSGTTIDYVQVSYSGDDSFEWFGGNVNAKHLIAFRGWDDEFDTDNGFSGHLQFLVGLRDPNVADKSNSNGFESDNDASGSSNEPYTSCVFSNVSLFGPYTTLSDNVNPTGGNGAFHCAMHLRRNTKLKVYNSVFAGWPYGLFIENGGKGDAQGNATNGDLVVKNCIISGSYYSVCKEDATTTSDFDINYFTRTGGNNSSLTTNAELGLNNPFSLTAPDFTAASGSTLLTGASFTDTPLTNSFFDTSVNFVGAFGTTDWTKGWANFNPQNTDY
jgi:hypothetical protein